MFIEILLSVLCARRRVKTCLSVSAEDRFVDVRISASKFAETHLHLHISRLVENEARVHNFLHEALYGVHSVSGIHERIHGVTDKSQVFTRIFLLRSSLNLSAAQGDSEVVCVESFNFGAQFSD